MLKTTHLPILPLTAIIYVAAEEQPDMMSHQLNSLANSYMQLAHYYEWNTIASMLVHACYVRPAGTFLQ